MWDRVYIQHYIHTYIHTYVIMYCMYVFWTRNQYVGGKITLVHQRYLTTVHNHVGRLVGYINAEGPFAMTLLRFCMIGSQ